MPVRSQRLAAPAFLVPVLSAVILLYRGLADLQIVLTQLEVVLVAAAVLVSSSVLGLLAAFGGHVIRVLVLTFTTVGLLEMTLQPSRFVDHLAYRRAAARDARRISDLHALQQRLDRHASEVGPLPVPSDYHEGAAAPAFWPGWWDVSAVDEDGDGLPFLDFLAAQEPAVPLDPVNNSPDPGDPRAGQQYVYFVVPRGYEYEGGVCQQWQDKWVYLLGVTRLETGRPVSWDRSACACLWANEPDFFAKHFDYVLCGTFDR